jgi:hypothetical protein
VHADSPKENEARFETQLPFLFSLILQSSLCNFRDMCSGHSHGQTHVLDGVIRPNTSRCVAPTQHVSEAASTSFSLPTLN